MPPVHKLISGGLNENGDEIYVGRGTVKGQTAANNLIISGPRAGLYFPHSRTVHHLTTGIEYFEREADCDYQWVASSDGKVVASAIQIDSPPYTFYVGRVFAHNSYHIGKTTLEHKVTYYSYAGTEPDTPNYEVLVCKERPMTVHNQENSTKANFDIDKLSVMISDLMKIKNELDDKHCLEDRIESLQNDLKTKILEVIEVQKKLDTCESNQRQRP